MRKVRQDRKKRGGGRNDRNDPRVPSRRHGFVTPVCSWLVGP